MGCLERKSVHCNIPHLSTGDVFQDPQWMPEVTSALEPSI